MDANKILADFQFAGNRVSNFSIDTKSIANKGIRATLEYNIDYNVLNITIEENRYIGVIEFIVNIEAKLKDTVLFNISLVMEGVFIGNSKRISEEQFINMLELNGVATLSQLCRSYIISTSSLSGLNPPIKLPMLNIHALKELKDRKEDKEDENNMQ